MKRRIPATMATQHPDNARGPFWEREDGFVSAREEPEECVVCLRDLGVRESASVFFFSKFGVSSAAAFNASMCMFLVNVLLPSIAGALLVLKVKMK